MHESAVSKATSTRYSTAQGASDGTLQVSTWAQQLGTLTVAVGLSACLAVDSYWATKHTEPAVAVLSGLQGYSAMTCQHVRITFCSVNDR